MYDSALKPEIQREVARLGRRDIVVGLPAYRNVKTIGRLVFQVSQGLEQHYSHLRNLIVVADGGSTDGTSQAAAEAQLTPSVERVVMNYQGIQGRGSAVRSVFEIAAQVDARIVILLDADIRNPSPGWIRALAGPVLAGTYEFLVPLYVRALGEAALSHLIGYPLTRLLYGLDLKEPMAGESTLTGRLAGPLARRDVWETDVARAGVDVWLTTLAINEDLRLAQVPLGVKEHDSRDPIASIEPIFLQELGTLFRMMNIYRRRWREVLRVRAVPTTDELVSAAPPPVSHDVEALRQAYREGVKRYHRLWKAFLSSESWGLLQPVLSGKVDEARLGHEVWARLVVDFAVVYNKGEGDPDKVVTALVPLYQLRLASVLSDLRGADQETQRRYFEQQAQAFEAQRPFLVQRWDSFGPFPVEYAY